MMTNCNEIILSENYADLIINYPNTPYTSLSATFNCYQPISGYYGTAYIPLSSFDTLSLQNYSYSSIPALYGIQEKNLTYSPETLLSAIDVSGISRLQNYPSLSLKGQGCIMAYIDTGINIEDYSFRYSNGSTRILSLWDMSDTSGIPPEGIFYGSEYSENMINSILEKSDSSSNLPGHDNSGHGNTLAKIGSGTDGVAPESYIVVVKLKTAKQYLKKFHRIRDDALAFQENDIMLAVNYVKYVALKNNLPVSLCLCLGTNSRSHDGRDPLSYILDRFESNVNAISCICAGDELNKRLHSLGVINNTSSPSSVELRIDEKQQGINIHIWGTNPQIFSVGLKSPTGETIPVIPARIGKSEIYNLVFDNSTVSVSYDLVEADSGDQLILISIDNPTPGIWSIDIYGDNITTGSYNAYLPISEFIYENTYFISSQPDTTITDPGFSSYSITSSRFNPETMALYINNGRGFSRLGEIKPDLCTPLSSAITAGAACLFFTWAVTLENRPYIRGSEVKSYLIRGAMRSPNLSYPDKAYGYGFLNIFESFERIRGN